MTKVKKNSTRYQENIRKQQFLNKHGVIDPETRLADHLMYITK